MINKPVKELVDKVRIFNLSNLPNSEGITPKEKNNYIITLHHNHKAAYKHHIYMCSEYQYHADNWHVNKD